MNVQLIVCPWVASTRLQRGNPAQIMKAAASAVRRRWLQYTHTHTLDSVHLRCFWTTFKLKRSLKKHSLFLQIMFATAGPLQSLKIRGAGSTVVGIICPPLFEIGLTDLSKTNAVGHFNLPLISDGSNSLNLLISGLNSTTAVTLSHTDRHTTNAHTAF